MEGKTKFLLQNSSEMLAADFEMIKIFTLWQNDFFFPAWGLSSGMEYSPLISRCFTPVQWPVWKISVQDSPVIFTFFFFMILVTSDFGP